MKIIGIIPARYKSSRFPGKPLAKIKGETMISRVYKKVSKTLTDVYVATDDERIYNEVKNFGGNVVMTSTEHQSGTDRIEEAVTLLPKQYDVVINIQGDEPFIQTEQIELLSSAFKEKKTQIATLGKLFTTTEEIINPNSPKIALTYDGYALYFSRNLLPFIKGETLDSIQKIDNLPEHFPYLKHIGIYAYRRNVLKEITKLPQSPLELIEGLEQLRWLENGYRIKVERTTIETIGIDTPEDLKRAELFLESSSLLD